MLFFDKFSNTPSVPLLFLEKVSLEHLLKYLKFILELQQMNMMRKIKDLSPPDAISYLEIKYLDIEFLFGANIGIRKEDVFAIEDIILDKEDGDYLDDFGKMILKLFPSSEMGHYYLGKYYESGKDFRAALRQYRLGYGKMNPRDPNANLFYQNIERLMNKTN